MDRGLIKALDKRIMDSLRYVMNADTEKKYKVLVYGHFEKEHDRIDFEIDRSKAKMVCRPKIDKLKLNNIFPLF